LKQIVGAYGTLIILLFHLFTCVTVSIASEQAEAAKSYKAGVIAEIENSDFNRTVIDSCIAQAAAVGYELYVNPCTYDGDMRVTTAEVILNYKCSLLLLGITQEMTTRGFAR
jgi:ABC-type sugar transport system substrate-binding protein